MKLARQFDWTDLETIYVKANEETDFEHAKEGMVSFTVHATDGRSFIGKCFQTTAAKMCDAPAFWKLHRGVDDKGMPRKYADVVACNEKGA